MIKIGDKKRLILIFSSLFFLFSLLFIQFYRLQVIERAKWAKEARAQHQFVFIEPGKRGIFYGNNSLQVNHPSDDQPLVIDVLKYHLFIDPMQITEGVRKQVQDKLLSLLPISDTTRFTEQFEKKSRSRQLFSYLEKKEREQILKWWFPFAKKHKLASNAIFFLPAYQRSYPGGALMGQLLHTVREEPHGREQVRVPTGGLEQQFNAYLKGKEGKRLLQRSPRHSMETDIVLENPKPGANVYLTVNPYLQAVVEEEVARAVARAEAKGGWAVMMDPYTGEILALGQVPSFHPAEVSKYFNDPTLEEHTKVKAVIDCFEPGSTFKPLIIAAALKGNTLLEKQGKKPFYDPDEMLSTLDGKVPGRKPIRDLRQHRFMNMDIALQKSGNIYMAKVIEKTLDQFGERWFREAFATIFGLGQKTGVEIPGESAGLLPTPGKFYPGNIPQWTSGTPYTFGLGHNLLVNTIQMVRAFSVIASRGKLPTPTIVRKIVAPDTGEVLLNHLEKRDFPRVMSEESCEKLIHALKFVTKVGGTTPKADIHGYTEAGKSGTSEKVKGGKYCKDVHISSFVGFAPAKNPRFVLMVVIDEPKKQYIPGIGKMHHGGTSAGPAFAAIAKKTFDYLGIPPDDPFGFPIGDPRASSEKSDYYKERQELDALYKKWNQGK